MLQIELQQRFQALSFYVWEYFLRLSLCPNLKVNYIFGILNKLISLDGRINI